ncbi:trypsin-like peptidase domain-containing protein [Saprospiraceae bacterium]|nr:trypsin-like peptidase domain-containing protein [Saprospiraceae bacterium]
MKHIILFIFISVTSLLYGQTLKDHWLKCNDNGCELLDPYYSEGVSFKWDGSCVEGKANGYGTAIKYENSILHSTYIGEYVDGIRTGSGKMVRHLSNETWEGNFINGQLSGYGKYKNENGNRYEGNFINYMQHGKGTKYYGNGNTFEGLFNSFIEYTGVLTYPNRHKRYIYRGGLADRKSTTNSNYSPKLNQEITEYFDENWERCEVKKAKYYRLITYISQNTPKGKIIDFYMYGQKQSEFNALYIDYSDENLNFHVGEAKWYHTNGKLSRVCNYYQTNRIEGLDITYFDNGNKASEIYYTHGVLNGQYNSYYKTGKPKITALYELDRLVDNRYIEYDENGLGAIVYNENFTRNQDKWEANFEGSKSQINEDNQLEFLVTSENTTSRFNYISLNQNSDYSIESIVQKKNGKDNNGYGLLFGFKDWDNYYQFLISGNGSYMISRKFEGIKMDIAEWTSSDNINTGNARNLLKIIKIDDTFIFSINGQVVQRDESSSLRGNNFGMLVGGKGDYILENIAIKEFVSSEQLNRQTPETNNSNTSNWNGNGSGIIISKDGYIVTNYHVIKNTSAIEVEFKYQGQIKSFKAKIVKSDKTNDLAIIKIDDSSFNNLKDIPYNFKTRSSDVGSSVFALGYPMALTMMGKDIKFTDGKISSKTGFQGDITTYQTTTPIQPGNSGGPLFDYKGNLLGINSSGLDKSVADNVSYSIKTSYILNLIDVLPKSILLPSSTELATKPLTEQIKVLSDFVVLIKVK